MGLEAGSYLSKMAEAPRGRPVQHIRSGGRRPRLGAGGEAVEEEEESGGGGGAGRCADEAFPLRCGWPNDVFI